MLQNTIASLKFKLFKLKKKLHSKQKKNQNKDKKNKYVKRILIASTKWNKNE